MKASFETCQLIKHYQKALKEARARIRESHASPDTKLDVLVEITVDVYPITEQNGASIHD